MALIKTDELFNRGMNIVRSGGDIKAAEHMFNTILNQNVDADSVIFALGCCAMVKGNFGLGANLFQQAVSKNRKFAQAWNNLGCCYRNLGMVEKARYSFENAVNLEEDPEFVGNLGGSYIGTGSPGKAIYYLDKCLANITHHQSSLNNKSLAYLEMGDWQRGFALYDNRVATGNHKERHYHEHGTPEWDGTPGRTVVVYGEQGIGDEIMFASVLPDIIKVCSVILDVHPRLAGLFRIAFPQIPVYGTRKMGEIVWSAMHQIDAKISIGSLPRLFRFTNKDFPKTPYLKPDDRLSKKVRSLIESCGRKPRIGISWKGGTKKTNGIYRTVPLHLWKSILNVDATFFSLQYQEDAEYDLKRFYKESPNMPKIHHFREVLNDYDETAALVSNLDLVISVPQSVVHLAGALGVPCWQLTPKRAMWQMGQYGRNMPWYGCVKSYWQASHGHWEEVLGRVTLDVKGFIRERFLKEGRERNIKIEGVKNADYRALQTA